MPTSEPVTTHSYGTVLCTHTHTHTITFCKVLYMYALN